MISDSGAVTTIFSTAPGHHSSIGQDRSKSTACATNLLDIRQLILDAGAVTTIAFIALTDNSVTSNARQRKRMLCHSYLWELCNSNNGVSTLKSRQLSHGSVRSKKAPGAANLKKCCPKDSTGISGSLYRPYMTLYMVGTSNLGS
jgi:hypothetical protein